VESSSQKTAPVWSTFAFFWYLVVEFPVGIGSEEIGSDVRHDLLGDHGQPGLQGVVHLDLTLHRDHLDTARAVGRQPVVGVEFDNDLLVDLGFVLGQSRGYCTLHQGLVGLATSY